MSEQRFTVQDLSQQVARELGPYLAQLHGLWRHTLCGATDCREEAATLCHDLSIVMQKHIARHSQLQERLQEESESLRHVRNQMLEELGFDVQQESQDASNSLKAHVLQLQERISLLKAERASKSETARQLTAQLRAVKLELENTTSFIINPLPEGVSQQSLCPRYINWLETELDACTKLKEQRQNEIRQYYSEIMQLLHSVNASPQDMQNSILARPVETLPPNANTLNALQKLLSELRSRKLEFDHRRRADVASLEVELVKVCQTWESLRIPPQERPEWWSQVCHKTNGQICYQEGQAMTLYSHAFAQQVKLEISRLENLAATRIDVLIEKHVHELHKIWDRLKTPHEMRLVECPVIANPQCTTQTLAKLEQQLLAKQSELSIKLPIIVELERRQEFLEQVRKFEEEASDPTRFKRNTADRFLVEQKFRVKAAEKIRALDLLVETKIRQWEEEWDQIFTYAGRCFLLELYAQQESRGIMELQTRVEAPTSSRNGRFTPILPQNVIGKRTPRLQTRALYSSTLETPRAATLRTASQMQVASSRRSRVQA